MCIINCNHYTVQFTKVAEKHNYGVLAQNIYKDCFLEVLCKSDELKQSSIYKLQRAGNKRTVPGTKQMSVWAHAECFYG